MSATSAIAATSAATIAAASATETQRSEHTMLAVTQDRYGNADVLNVETIDRPSIANDEVLLEVVAAGLDRGVVHLMTGLPYLIRILGYGFRKPKTPVLGMDVAGRVVEVGSSVTDLQVGDEVMGIAKGSFAQFAAADADKLVLKPEAVSFETAAVSAISGMTAFQALVSEGEVDEGERVLIVGASGGVGSFAVQIAAALGAEVTGVASGEKADFVRTLGAVDAIDYKTTDLRDVDEQFDLIIDIGGRNSLRTLRGLLTKTGRLVIVGGEDGGALAGGISRQLGAALLSPFISQQLGFFMSEESRHYIQSIADLLATGDVVAVVDSTRTLDEVPHAIRALVAGDVSGKVVIDVGAHDDNA